MLMVQYRFHAQSQQVSSLLNSNISIIRIRVLPERSLNSFRPDLPDVLRAAKLLVSLRISILVELLDHLLLIHIRILAHAHAEPESAPLLAAAVQVTVAVYVVELAA
jgi:hypothetical protein